MAAKSENDVFLLGRKNIEPAGELSCPVVPGKPFARLLEDTLPGKMKGGVLREEIPESSNLVFMDDGNIAGSVYGMVVEDPDAGLRVEPLWTVSDNALSVMMDFHPEDCFGEELGAKELFAALRDAFPEAGIDKDHFRGGCVEARKNGVMVKNIAVARGHPPNLGCDGVVKMKVGVAARAGTVMENGSVDYRERGGFVGVSEGEVLAELIPPTKGTPGRNVFGRPVPAPDGVPVELKAGKGVVREEAEGLAIFKAARDGMVMFADNTLSVSEVMEIDSDVDMSTGNVHVDVGSIHIKGAVITGSTVTAAENVVVDDVVESANVKAGGDVIVAGGIIMDEGAMIEAGGDVRAKFLRNAKIRAGGNVEAEVDMAGCDIIAGGKVLALTDKGVLNGGRYEVRGGLDVSETGSDTGVSTELVVSSSVFDGEDTGAEKAAVDERLALLERLVGADDSKSTLLLAPKEDRLILAELFKVRKQLLMQSEALSAGEEEALEAQGKKLAEVHLRVRKTAHPDTSISIADRTIVLQQAEQASKFHWDPETGGIAVTGL